MPDIFEEIARLRAAGERAALATVISARGSTPGKETMRILVPEAGPTLGSVGGGLVEAEVIAAAREVLQDETPRRLRFRLTETGAGGHGLLCGGELEVFVEPLAVPALVLFGAGHVSQDLCEVAARAGFAVTVLDDRAEFANAGRFPRARRVLARETMVAGFPETRLGPSSYAVVVTRGHDLDLECTDFALHGEAAYVGLIGSRGKVRAILGRLRDAGRLAGVDLTRLHAPVGLDLGAETAGEIAVAVVAEMVAHRRGRLAEPGAKRIPAEEMARIAGRSGLEPPSSACAVEDDAASDAGEAGA